ncbi:hypothetical protein AYO21_11766 [Fonsecaea monophora]|uniref:AAA+ ATPase domain-containing protein n=1 Tax=Fonsecaea monophora TaxID=254056 RepID=A0A177EQ79_9EURO|nr:hypothetical protein AYO21_11766 [Fonsecaea monophora]OAG34097.1 hypothetical protein AYO21_11766 [Fonsecaea monophora]
MDVRLRARKIAHRPGGRHDNDFEDIHAIHIMPTAEELASKDPYLPRVQDMDNPCGPTSLAAQVDRHFRLLHEDMISDLRDELGHIRSPDKSPVRKRLRVFSLSLAGALCDEKRQWSLQFECLIGLPQINALPPGKKKKFVKENTNYLKDNSVGCLMIDDHSLPENSGGECQKRDIKGDMIASSVFIQLNTPMFSYEPILKQLKAIRNIPLAKELFAGDKDCMVNEIDYNVNPSLQSLLEQVEKGAVVRIDKVLGLPREIRLDKSQAQRFLAEARQKVCTIQGPPGTGKSFMGSLIAKPILHFTNERIPVVCYTHHALDQFLKELLDLGIPDSDIVRFGSTKKATVRTKPLSLQESPSSRRLIPIQFNMLQKARDAVTRKGRALQQAVALEGKMTQVSKGGRKVDRFYLLDQWRRGKDAGIFQRSHGSRFPEDWNLKAAEGSEIYEQWKREMMETVSALVCEAGEVYNKALAQVRAIYMEKDLEVMRQKRIIACTTTAAAKYVKHVQSVSPGVGLVEEAREILESHILTAIRPSTKQLILVGDHQQLRPKISNYNLTVDKSEGYNLNRSLFERLVLEGSPHQVLVEQHRMRPELSAILRELTYPELCDAPNTKGRPDLRGCTDNLIFLDHRHSEVELVDVREWRDGYTPSRKNLFEGEMTWKCDGEDRPADPVYSRRGGGEQLQEDREKALQQRQRDLKDLQQSLSQEPPSHVAEPTTSVTGETPKAPRTPLPKGQVRPSQSPNITWPEPPPTPEDSPEFEWQRQKRVENATNDAIDAIMAMAGLKEVKTKILTIKAKTDVVKRQNTDMKKERLGMVMLGNSGKTSVARYYAKFLTSVGALRGSGFVGVTGSSLANEGVAGTKKHIENLIKSGGGVFFLDEAYQLTSGNSFGGGVVLDFLLTEIEEKIGSIVFIFAGYTKEMEKFFEHNPGLEPLAPPNSLCGLFECRTVDYDLYAKILVDRLGVNRGMPGSENARSLHNTWSRVSERQAQRLVKERKDGLSPDDLFFSKDDLIGPQPKGVLQTSAAWRELQSMIGLKQVKESINTLVGGVEKNHHRELVGKPPIQVSLNRNFTGNPGTGKTSVGKLYAAILAELGLLSKNEVVYKTPSDFVGARLGESERDTKAILRASESKVLLIDEAYGPLAGCGVGKGQADIYKAAVIDTIVGEVKNTPGEDRCVLLLGYEDDMKEMLDNSNPGLARRFPISEAFHFDDFGDEELRQILDFKLKKQGLDATDEAKDVVIGILSKTRDRPNFVNAGEVENLIG